MKYCTRMELTIRTLFLTAYAHILNLELCARVLYVVLLVVCEILNFIVYKTSHKTSVPWRIHMVNPPYLTFPGFYHHEEALFIDGGSHSQLELLLLVVARLD